MRLRAFVIPSPTYRQNLARFGLPLGPDRTSMHEVSSKSMDQTGIGIASLTAYTCSCDTARSGLHRRSEADPDFIEDVVAISATEG